MTVALGAYVGGDCTLPREQVIRMVAFGEGEEHWYAIHFEDGCLAVLQDKAQADSGFVEYAGTFVCEASVSCMDVCPCAPRLIAGLSE